MIEGLILMAELGLFLILLLKVWRVRVRGEEESGGFFAYRLDNTAKAGEKGARRPGGPPHA